MPATRGQKVLRFLLGVMPLRLAWAACGAYVGLLMLFGGMHIVSLLPSPAPSWLNLGEIPLGPEATLPVFALVWLGFAAAGALAFTLAWSRALSRVTAGIAMSEQPHAEHH